MSISTTELFKAVDRQIGQIADSLDVWSNVTWDEGETQSIAGLAWVREGNQLLPIPFSVTLPAVEKGETK